MEIQKEPIVSVCMITYNHEKFIRHALDSVLMQKTNFDYEILIGDDCSTDNTVRIIEEIQNKYPNRIQLFKRKKNMGMCANSYNVMCHARGKYIANLEGDDYWTTENKLQKLYDFLENNLDCSAVGHRVEVVNEFERPLGRCIPDTKPLNRRFGKQDVLKYSVSLIHTGSWMHRNFIRNNIDKYAFMGHHHRNFGGHKLRIFLLADMGNIYIMDDIMGAYRFVNRPRAGNSISLQNNDFEWEKGMIDSYLYMQPIFGNRYDFSSCLAKSFIQLCLYKLKNKNTPPCLIRYFIKIGNKGRCMILPELGRMMLKI